MAATRAVRAALLLLCGFVAACGSGGGDSSDTPPTISALSFSPAAVYVGAPGSTASVLGTLDFADPEGDLETLELVIFDSTGGMLSSASYGIDLVGKPKSGVLEGQLTVGIDTPDRYTFRVTITDRKGNVSNALEGEFRVAEFPWVSLDPMPTPRRDFATAVLDGLIYVVGGGDVLAGITPAPALATVEIFDPATGGWSPAAPLPVAMTDHVAAAVGAEIVVVGTGTSGGLFQSLVQVYDPATETWSPGADGPLARSHAAAAAIGGELFVVGGTEGGFDLSSMDVYDPAADAWSSATAMTAPRRDLAAVAIGGRLLALGGYTTTFVPDGGYRRIVESYDSPTGAWSAVPGMPEARADAAVAAIGSQVFVAGGGNVQPALDGLMVLDSDAGTWSVKTPMPVAMAWPRAEAVGGKLYVFDTDVTLAYDPDDEIQ